MKRRGPDKELPSWAHWPICVRPPGSYLGAYVVGSQADDQADDNQAEDAQVDEVARSPLAELLDQILADLDAGRVAPARATLVELRDLV